MRATPDDILGMAFFARVVEAKSFSVAARTLGVSKSAVSARVARLEKSLGVRLLHRTTRRLALTADGVRVYELCARVVAGADEAAEVAHGASATPRGTLRIHAPSALGDAYLTKPIGDFMQSYPGVRIELRLSDRMPETLADEHDIAIVMAERLADSGLTARKLAHVRLVACASPTYLRRKGIPFRPQDLVHHDFLAHTAGHARLRFETDEGAVATTSRAALHVDDARFLRQAALAGLGIVMLPELLVVEDFAGRRLHRVLDDFHSIELGIHALHPHARLAPASVRAFLDHLTAAFRSPAWTTPRAIAPETKRKSGGGAAIAITEQDVRRLLAVAAVYEDVEPEGAERLRAKVSRAKAVAASKVARTTVTLNSRVRLRDGSGADRELALVYPWDAAREKVSVLSATGTALLGAAVGSSLADGRRAVTIVAIPYQPEAAGDHHL